MRLWLRYMAAGLLSAVIGLVVMLISGCASYSEYVRPPIQRVRTTTWCEGAYHPALGTNFARCPGSAPKIVYGIQSLGAGSSASDGGSSSGAGASAGTSSGASVGGVGHGHGHGHNH